MLTGDIPPRTTLNQSHSWATLKWYYHVSQLCTKVSMMIFLLKTLKYEITDPYVVTRQHVLGSCYCRRKRCESLLRLYPTSHRLAILTVYGQYV